MSMKEELLRNHSALVNAADGCDEYEAAWSLRFDAGYSAALVDLMHWLESDYGQQDAEGYLLQRIEQYLDSPDNWIDDEGGE